MHSLAPAGADGTGFDAGGVGVGSRAGFGYGFGVGLGKGLGEEPPVVISVSKQDKKISADCSQIHNHRNVVRPAGISDGRYTS